MRKFAPSEMSGRYWKLNKSLCELKQSPKQQRKKLDKVIEALSFTKSIADDLLYLFWKENILILIIAIQVDDIVISSSGLMAIFKIQFSNYFKITNFRELRYIL